MTTTTKAQMMMVVFIVTKRQRSILMRAWYVNGTGLIEQGKINQSMFIEINQDFQDTDCSYHESIEAMKMIINELTGG